MTDAERHLVKEWFLAKSESPAAPSSLTNAQKKALALVLKELGTQDTVTLPNGDTLHPDGTISGTRGDQ